MPPRRGPHRQRRRTGRASWPTPRWPRRPPLSRGSGPARSPADEPWRNQPWVGSSGFCVSVPPDPDVGWSDSWRGDVVDVGSGDSVSGDSVSGDSGEATSLGPAMVESALLSPWPVEPSPLVDPLLTVLPAAIAASSRSISAKRLAIEWSRSPVRLPLTVVSASVVCVTFAAPLADAEVPTPWATVVAPAPMSTAAAAMAMEVRLLRFMISPSVDVTTRRTRLNTPSPGGGEGGGKSPLRLG